MRRLRLYLDTSVIGGYFDEEFAEVSKRLFGLLQARIYKACLSDITLLELLKAPEPLVEHIEDLLESFESEELKESAESLSLARAYVESGVLPSKCLDDARHVSLATCEKVDYILSWNFKHLVNVERIRGFNAVNLRHGYWLIDIRTPLEVVAYGTQEI